MLYNWTKWSGKGQGLAARCEDRSKPKTESYTSLTYRSRPKPKPSISQDFPKIVGTIYNNF